MTDIDHRSTATAENFEGPDVKALPDVCDGRTGDRPADAAHLPIAVDAITAGRTTQADRVSNLRQYHGLLWSAERVAELRAMLAEGASRADIARALGVTRNAVAGKVDRMGMATPRPRVRKPRPPRVRIRAEKRDIPRPKTPIKSTEPSPRRDLLRHIGKVLIWDLGQSSCRWPLFGGNEPVSQQFYCGDEAVTGAPYCGPHCAQAFTPARCRP